MDRLLLALITAVTFAVAPDAHAAEGAVVAETTAPPHNVFAHRPVIIGAEVLAATSAGLATTLLASGIILGTGLDSPFRSPVSFALLAILPPIGAGFGAWGAGLLEPRFGRSWRVALLGAATGGLLAMAGVTYFFRTDSPSPGIPLAYALGVLVAGTPVLSAVGATVALELFGRTEVQVAVLPSVSVRGEPLLAVAASW